MKHNSAALTVFKWMYGRNLDADLHMHCDLGFLKDRAKSFLKYGC